MASCSLDGMTIIWDLNVIIVNFLHFINQTMNYMIIKDRAYNLSINTVKLYYFTLFINKEKLITTN
jgi:hypothetical protein